MRFLLNSAIVAGVAAVSSVVVSSLAGFSSRNIASPDGTFCSSPSSAS
jgi:ABC-type glycerol-3-phosphate transport system permease component